MTSHVFEMSGSRIIFIKYGCIALKDTGSAFLLLCDKTHTRCRHCSSICAS